MAESNVKPAVPVPETLPIFIVPLDWVIEGKGLTLAAIFKLTLLPKTIGPVNVWVELQDNV